MDPWPPSEARRYAFIIRKLGLNGAKTDKKGQFSGENQGEFGRNITLHGVKTPSCDPLDYADFKPFAQLMGDFRLFDKDRCHSHILPDLCLRTINLTQADSTRCEVAILGLILNGKQNAMVGADHEEERWGARFT